MPFTQRPVAQPVVAVRPVGSIGGVVEGSQRGLVSGGPFGGYWLWRGCRCWRSGRLGRACWRWRSGRLGRACWRWRGGRFGRVCGRWCSGRFGRVCGRWCSGRFGRVCGRWCSGRFGRLGRFRRNRGRAAGRRGCGSRRAVVGAGDGCERDGDYGDQAKKPYGSGWHVPFFLGGLDQQGGIIRLFGVCGVGGRTTG